MSPRFCAPLLGLALACAVAPAARSEIAPPASAVEPAGARVAARTDARDAFRRIRSYHCYYGPGRTEALLTRDASIIETRAQTPADVDALRAAGRLAIAYISIGEDHDRRVGDGRGPGGFDSAYFDRDGDRLPDKNPVWNSYYANAASASWREFFLDNAARLRSSHGVDGFFLDTVETCLLYPESREGMATLIRELRTRHPDAIIVLNRGWDLLPALGDTPDGLMFESFTLSYDFDHKRYEPLRPSGLDYGLDVWRRLLRPAQEKHGLVVLALDYAASPDDPSVKLAYDRAATLGLVPCLSTILLDGFHEVSHAGVRDERWLRPQETELTRSVILDTARNGFPAGTRVEPSSNHADYSAAPVVDGIAAGAAKRALGWRERAWASLESPDTEHVLKFTLPGKIRASALEIDWAWDGGAVFPARDFRVEILPAGAEAEGWKPVARREGNTPETSRVALPAAEFIALRIVQAPGGGAPARPDLMWVQQVRLVR